MKNMVLLIATLCLTLTLACVALADVPSDDDVLTYRNFVSKLAENGYETASDDQRDLQINSYDGTDFVTVTYKPASGLVYSIEYEDDSLYMVALSISPDSGLYENADDLILYLLQATDASYASDADAREFIENLRQSEEKTAKGDQMFQVFNPQDDDSDFYRNLNAMVYFQ